MFVTAAFAQGSNPLGGDSLLVTMLPFVLIFVIMYFLILRPQQKRVKAHQELVKNVRRGDTVVTNGGLVGRVTKVIDDNEIEIELSDDVRVRQMRGMITSLLPFALIFVIMYFLILRPQQKRVKAHQEMVKNVRRGDTVVTNGGLIGRVTKVVDDNEIEVELADEVRVRQMRSMIADVRAKGEPVKDDVAAKS